MDSPSQFCVEFYGRKPYAGQYSIEASFVRISRALQSNGVVVKTRTAPRRSRGIWSRFLIIMDVARIRTADIIHVTGDIHFAVLFASNPVVLTIHDLQMLSRLSGLRRCLLKLFWFTLPCWRADKICVISEATRARLLSEVPWVQNKIEVVPSIVSEQLSPRSKSFNDKKPRVLCIGTKKNKNLERIAAAISGISATLVVVGRVDDDLANVFASYEIQTEIHVDLTDAELTDLYGSVDLLALVSIEEGFGMPIIEAQRMMVPVITSNTSSMPEVAGDGAVLVDPFDVEAIRDGIKSVICDEQLRTRIVCAGTDNAKRFNSATVAKQLMKMYVGLLDD